MTGKDAEYKDAVVESLAAVRDSANGDVHSNPVVSNSAVELAKVLFASHSHRSPTVFIQDIWIQSQDAYWLYSFELQ